MALSCAGKIETHCKNSGATKGKRGEERREGWLIKVLEVVRSNIRFVG